MKKTALFSTLAGCLSAILFVFIFGIPWRSADLKAWPLPKPTPTPEVSPLTWKMPKLTKVTDDMPLSEQQKLEHYNFVQMIKHHPDPETREYFIQEVFRDRRLRPAFIYGNDHFTGGLIAKLEAHERLAGAMDTYPYIQMNAKFVRSAEDADVLTFWTTVQHELVHYDQFVSARGSDMPGELASFIEGVFPNASTEEMCTVMWEHQTEAFRGTCEFIYRAGLQGNKDQQYSFCPWYQSVEFKHAFFLDAMERSEKGLFSRIGGPPVCLPHYAELAGHPHPEAFRAE